MVTNQYQRSIRTLQSDNGKEFADKILGTQIMEVVQASLFGMNMPKFYWGEAVKSAAYLINRTPSRKMESLLSVPHLPNLELRVFGCTVYVYIPKVMRVTPQPTQQPFPLLIFAASSAYMIQKRVDRVDSPHKTELTESLEQRSILSRGAERQLLQTQINPLHGSSYNNSNSSHYDVRSKAPPPVAVRSRPRDAEELISEAILLSLQSLPSCRNLEVCMRLHLSGEIVHCATHSLLSKPASKPASKLHHGGLKSKTNKLDKLTICDFEICIFSTKQLEFKVTLGGDGICGGGGWRQRHASLLLHNHASILLCKIRSNLLHRLDLAWKMLDVATTATRIEEAVSRMNKKGARNSEENEDDIFELEENGGVLQQFDIKNAFLNGDLEEEVYMDLPLGAKQKSSRRNEVCQLKKSLYGLKQSPWAWFGRFSSTMKEFGYKQRNSDHTLFIKHKEGKITTLIVYVDDMVLTGDDPEERKALQQFLASKFEMKDLGQLKYFLGIEVSRSKIGICLHRKYVLDLLTETGMLECKPFDTPMVMNHKLREMENQTLTDKGCYQRVHQEEAYCSQKGRFAKLKGIQTQIWAGNQTDRRSTSGYLYEPYQRQSRQEIGRYSAKLKALKSEGENRVLTQAESSRLQNLLSDQWSISRQTWCRLGNRSIKRSRDNITQIKYKGTTFFTPEDIKEAAVSFYSELFTAPVAKRACLGGMGLKKLSPNMAGRLESKKLFGAVMDLKAPGAEGFEVKEVIWRCDGSKELSPEGFTFAFYRKAWIILGNELLQLVNGFLRTGKLAKGIQAPHDALVSHNTDRLAKSMAITKQKCVMPSVISSNQTALIAGRQILEGFMIANEVVHCLKRRDDTGFIFMVMQSMGFGDQLWRRLIRECIWSTKRITFPESGRLRLFLGNLNAHLQYADDTLVSFPNDFMSFIHVKRILMWFELASGLRLNFYKSSSLWIEWMPHASSDLATGQLDRVFQMGERV
uniref:Reverse transcriptase Ty1/copia-type domain-containing protein n=1 Tax=Salix viminalis TaxID=40686 RepID=A0A6N2MWL7_SALVM